ncbi:MAG: hypothetical protein PHC69_09705 [Ruminiclostridium sp.]|nr:hypothetical protein [Ruminiclostridium sp.]
MLERIYKFIKEESFVPDFLSNYIKETGNSVYLGGGALRDLFYGFIPKDFDFRVGSIKCFLHWLNEHEIPWESIVEDLIKVEEKNIVSGLLGVDYKETDMENHLKSIDFTINSVLWDINGKELIVKSEHLADLKAKILRTELTKDEFFSDPLRIYRAFRLQKKFDLRLDKQLEEYLVPENITREIAFFAYRNYRFYRELKKCVKDVGVNGLVEILREPIIKELSLQVKEAHRYYAEIMYGGDYKRH